MRSYRPKWPQPGKVSSREGDTTSRKPGLLLVLDASDSALNVEEYALRFAETQDWNVNILHVLDLDQFPESENPLSMSRMLHEAHRRSAQRLQSYKTVVDFDVQITASEPIVASLFQLQALQEQIQRICPQMVIVGRNTFTKAFLKTFVRQTPFPVLIVPETQFLQRPGSLLLYSDGQALKESMLQPVLSLVAITRQRLSILAVVNRKKFGLRKFQSCLPFTTGSLFVNFYQQEGANSILTIEKFVGRRSFDMVSIIVRDCGWIRRLFCRWSFVDLAFGIDVPLLVFKGK